MSDFIFFFMHKYIYWFVDKYWIMSSGSQGEEINSEYLTTVVDHFGSDLDAYKLKLNLSMLPNLCDVSMLTDKPADVAIICNTLNSLGPAQNLCQQVNMLICLFLLLPASSASAKRSFSAMRRLWNYLRKQWRPSNWRLVLFCTILMGCLVNYRIRH